MMKNQHDPRPFLRAKHTKQLQKTELCKFFLANRCSRGRGCDFAHTLGELREKPDLNRTSMCPDFLLSGNCQNPQCTFAHCEQDLRTTTPFFKSKMCRFAFGGRCKHGEKCRFAHDESELNPNTIPDEALTGVRRAQASLCKVAASISGVPSEQSACQEEVHIVRSAHSISVGSTASPVPTSEGSEDSRLEETAQTNPPPQRFPCDDGQDRSELYGTTVVLSNVPKFLTQGSVVSLLEDLTENMRDAFDFFYCPWDAKQNKNLGYVIINFFSRSVAGEFAQQWSNRPLLIAGSSGAPLRVVPAALQGRAANIRHFSGFDLAQDANPRFRPLVRSWPHEELRPMALVKELICNSGVDTPQMPVLSQGPRRRAQVASANGGLTMPQQQQKHEQRPQLLRQHVLLDDEQQPQALGQHASQACGALPEAQDKMYLQPAENCFGETIDNGAWLQRPFAADMPQPCFAPERPELGSGVQTPEPENEHPMNHQVFAQVIADQFIGMLHAWNPDPTTQRLMQAAAELQSWQQPQRQMHGSRMRQGHSEIPQMKFDGGLMVLRNSSCHGDAQGLPHLQQT